MKPLSAILIGAGNRGAHSYAHYALQKPDELKFVAVAEPREKRRQRFSLAHQILPENQFESWEELLKKPLMADVALICTQDWQHTAPAIAAMKAGYHILLEKPMANKAHECRELLAVSRQTKRQMWICHVLRYTPHFQKMRELVESGVLGEIIQVDHRENVSWWHMAHSFVRGNWRSQAETSPMILAKCCHDLDILPWVLGIKPEKLASTGSLKHFIKENAPQGAPARCLDGCPVADTCPYYAPHIYLEMAPFWNSIADTSRGFTRWATSQYTFRPGMIKALSLIVPPLKQITNYKRWPLNVLSEEPDPESIGKALLDGPYGRCVYHCDNDVVDHQLVMMSFSGGASVNLAMHGHSHIEYRSTRIEGSHGRLMAEFGNGGAWITVDEHRSDWQMRFDTSAPTGEGHGGGDFRLMAAFLDGVRNNRIEEADQMARDALESHLVAFSAEESRLNNTVLTRDHWAVD